MLSFISNANCFMLVPVPNLIIRMIDDTQLEFLSNIIRDLYREINIGFALKNESAFCFQQSKIAGRRWREELMVTFECQHSLDAEFSFGELTSAFN